MSQELDEQYLDWLYRQIGSVRSNNPARTYWSLVNQLHHKEFVWLIPNDDNRVEDGKELRYEFLDARHIEADDEWLDLGCSMLEMLIGLSRRLSFEGEGGPLEWFWVLLTNLGIAAYTDKVNYDHEEVDEILNRVIWRTYQRDGQGGLFPLTRKARDQRNVELWYQMSNYLLERD